MRDSSRDSFKIAPLFLYEALSGLGVLPTFYILALDLYCHVIFILFIVHVPAIVCRSGADRQ